jgi:competence protein ComEC
MVERHQSQGRIGTSPWPQPGAAGEVPWLPGLPGLAGLTGLAGPMAARLREWAAAEVAPGRLFPWLPVAFGCGIVIYFTAEREPVWWVAAALAALLFALAFALRTRPAFAVALGFAVLAAGFATAAVKARLLDHPVLRATAYSVSVKGFVEAREERERSDRIVVRVAALDGGGPRLSAPPDRIRLSVRKGLAPPVGAFVALKARINPPSSPFRPGGYDLARDLYFQGIGATGLTLGAIKVEAPPQPGGLWLQFATAIAPFATPSISSSAPRCRAMPARSPRR